MRTLAFDGRMGASGDMLLGALIDVGADPAVLAAVENALPIRYAVETTTKNGIEATTVTVVRTDDIDTDTTREHDESVDHGHSHEPTHERDHDETHAHSHDDTDHAHSHDDTGHDHSDQPHTHDHSSEHDRTDVQDHDDTHAEDHDRTHAEGHGPHRSYADVVALVDSMGLPAAVEATARNAFRRLGEAEAAVHGESIDSIHFHEVGADDAIADIVGVALLVADLGPDRIVTTPVSVGGGTREMSHGTYPIPAPAVLELADAADWSIRGGPVDAEVLTPTGAALLAELADGVESLPSIEVDAAGYGAGDAAFDSHPNVLRATLGTGSRRLERESITVLETNLDDASPELLGGLQETLAVAGARDVSILPATMKKSRPGHLVKVICKPADAERVAHRLAVETGTLGVREHGAGHRWIAGRRFETASLEIDGDRYDIAVKVATTADGDVYDVSAEYDDAARVAAATDRPIGRLMARAERAVDVDSDASLAPDIDSSPATDDDEST